MNQENINLYDFVTVTGRKGVDCGKYIKIYKEDADVTLRQTNFSVGDNVYAFLDGEKQMLTPMIAKIYVIKSLKANEVTVRERTGKDFGFSGGVQGEVGFFYCGGEPFSGKTLTVEMADAIKIKEYDDWFIASAGASLEANEKYNAALDAIVRSFPKTGRSVESIASDLKFKISQMNK